jgi:hypothetical protein
MGTIALSRRYRDALTEYVLSNCESGLARAYELGRVGVDEGSGLLQFLCVHREAVNTIVDETMSLDERLKRLNASEDFLMEALSTFDMLSRGYLALLERSH